jgi:predicted tellurium resistance membrane protein TerC
MDIAALLTLTALEIVLGVDNIVFILYSCFCTPAFIRHKMSYDSSAPYDHFAARR